MNRLGIDYGLKRVGVAKSARGLKIAHALTTIQQEDCINTLRSLVTEHDIEEVVVGMPRSLQGNDTEQTKLTREFVKQLQAALSVPVQIIDEAGTSARARELGADDTTVDQLAAMLILQDYLDQIK